MIYSNFTIQLANLPQYTAFKGKYQEHIPYALLKLIVETDFSDQEGYREDHKDLVKAMLNYIDPRENINWVEHRYASSMKCGRFYPDWKPKNGKATRHSITELPRYIKHTILAILGWKDIDMRRAHPSIICEVAKKMGRKFENIERYLKNRDEILSELIEHYQIDFDAIEDENEREESRKKNTLTEDNVKDLFNCITFGGGFQTWIEDLEKEIKNAELTPFVRAYMSDIREVMDLVYVNNPELIDMVIKDKNEKIENQKRNEKKFVKGDLSEAQVRELKRSAQHYWCATIENEILHIAYKFALKKGVIRERYNVALEYDGFPFKPICEFDEAEFVKELNEKVKKEMKIDVVFDMKPFKKVIQSVVDSWNSVAQAIPVANVVGCDEIDIADITLDTAKNYIEWKAIFERDHCKIINKTMFIKAVKDYDTETFKEFITFSKKDLVASYEHYTYEKETKMGFVVCKYIEDWLKDKTMRVYEDIDCVPPPLVCNEKIFNIWTPFYITQLLPSHTYLDDDGVVRVYSGDEEEQKEMKEKAEYIVKHIETLIGDKNAYDYLMRWLGQMFKYPHLKTKAITFISEEGAGKGTILKIIKRMIGASKYLETTKPQDEVWGKFNPLMLDAYLVNINEMELKKAQDALGVIKGLITDTDMTINPKGKNPIKTKSYHRFWYSSNNEVPINTHQNDRRNLIIRCSDELINNKEHFTKMNAYLEDDKVLVGLYLYLTSLPNLDTFHQEEIPMTEYQQTINEANRTPLDLFLEYYTQDHYYDKDTIKCLYSEDILAEFKKWCDGKSLKWEMNAIKFSRSLGLMKLPKQTIISYKKGVVDSVVLKDGTSVFLHTNKGNKMAIDLDKLKTHYKMVAPVIEEENEEDIEYVEE